MELFNFNIILCALVAASQRIDGVAAKCTATLDEIVEAERMIGNKEEVPTRTYTLCEGTKFSQPQFVYQLEFGSNVLIQCGDDGSSSNNCELVDVRLAPGGDNVVFRGLTFQMNAASANGIILINSPGMVLTLEDCIFKDWTLRNQEIFFNTAGGTGLATLNIDRCQFLNTGVAIEASRPNNNIVIRDTIFQGTPYGAYGMINASGENNMITIENSCFFNPTSRGNIVRSQLGAQVSGTNNFGVINDEAGRNAADCTFAAMYPQKETDGHQPSCLDFDAPVCAVTGTSSLPGAEEGVGTSPDEMTETVDAATSTAETTTAATVVTTETTTAPSPSSESASTNSDSSTSASASDTSSSTNGQAFSSSVATLGVCW
eukprot:CAMPEP_0183704136 /NCGR_PEP_ID=MMETSP0737-20130205/1580_1 /TAXON_ID=385413 /ORGANISM="Thalassiosira miniscula, Strain CCMP1093" /LENGTH=373 /DNA_ID=CAMNT_0025930957 /DNA_START=151 /DNA_END=1269 /DNA_ORIENTATION=-